MTVDLHRKSSSPCCWLELHKDIAYSGGKFNYLIFSKILLSQYNLHILLASDSIVIVTRVLLLLLLP